MKKAGKGVLWSAIEQFSGQSIQFLISLILARILSPKDYGLIAMVTIITVIMQTINESGFSVALIQKKDRTNIDYSTIFFLNITLGLSLYIVAFFFAPVLANFYKEPLIINLTRVMALNVIISSFSIVQRVKLTIKLDFKDQAKASFSASLISGIIGVFLAINGFGVWAIVYQVIISNIIIVIFLWSLSKWVPELVFSMRSIKNLFSFASKLLLARLIDVIYNNIYGVIIGKFFSATQLGYYVRADALKNISSSSITGVIQRVSTPLLCEEQEDKNKLHYLLKNIITSAALIVYPIMFGLFALSEPLMNVLFGSKWLTSSYMLKILCPVGIIYVLNTFNLNILNALGRSDIALKLEILKKSFITIIIVVAVSHGIIFLLIGQIIISCLELSINTYYTKKFINYGFLQQIKDLKEIFIISAIMIIAIYLISSVIETDFLKLVICIGSGLCIYLALITYFNIGKVQKLFLLFERN